MPQALSHVLGSVVFSRKLPSRANSSSVNGSRVGVVSMLRSGSVGVSRQVPRRDGLRSAAAGDPCLVFWPDARGLLQPPLYVEHVEQQREADAPADAVAGVDGRRALVAAHDGADLGLQVAILERDLLAAAEVGSIGSRRLRGEGEGGRG